MLNVISQGVPNRGMPGFKQLGEARIHALMQYLGQLQGKGTQDHLPGDAARGKTMFFGDAGCSRCHMVAGSGGFLGPDLSSYSQTHTVAQLKAAITNLGEQESRTAIATVITADGHEHRGIVRNEDNFSLQLQSLDGTFHFFSKSAIKADKREPASIMHSDFAAQFTASQLDDLVHYLFSTGGKGPGSERAEEREQP